MSWMYACAGSLKIFLFESLNRQATRPIIDPKKNVPTLINSVREAP